MKQGSPKNPLQRQPCYSMSMSCVRGIFGWIRDGQDIAPRTLRCSLELIFFRTPTRWAGREKEYQLFLSPTAPDTGIRESRAGPSTISSTLYARSIPKRRCPVRVRLEALESTPCPTLTTHPTSLKALPLGIGYIRSCCTCV